MKRIEVEHPDGIVHEYGADNPLMTLTGVIEMVPHSRSAIYYRVRNGGFPPPAMTALDGMGRKLLLWDKATVSAWVEENAPRAGGRPVRGVEEKG
jgi:predicted DNA-binding transcriptional regulator AlpA